jgi:transcriptional regulator with XRE-family HTH domain
MSNSERHKQKRKERSKQKQKQSVFSKIIEKGTSVITKKMQGKTLDENAETVMRVADRFGMPDNELAKETIKAAEKDIASCIKEGKTDEQILQPAFDSPNYQKLLKRCGLNNEHLKVILTEQRAKANEK